GPGMVDGAVQAAALLTVAGGGDDQLGDGGDVAELDQVAGQEDVAVVGADLLLEERDALAGSRQAAVAPHDADVVPQEAPDLVPVLRDDDRLVAVGGVPGVPGADVGQRIAVATEPLARRRP